MILLAISEQSFEAIPSKASLHLTSKLAKCLMWSVHASAEGAVAGAQRACGQSSMKDERAFPGVCSRETGRGRCLKWVCARAAIIPSVRSLSLSRLMSLKPTPRTILAGAVVPPPPPPVCETYSRDFEKLPRMGGGRCSVESNYHASLCP
ncbi:hypothetical protein KC362_g42 [Hortaea werneckii]|nr:hypothetical protein KC362_g42 [Hortaea werneckii]